MKYLLATALFHFLAAALLPSHGRAQSRSTNAKAPLTTKTIVFIHGLFMTKDCWREWMPYFEARGYRCLNLAYPGRIESAAVLRARHPDPAVAKQTLAEVVQFYADTIRQLPE